MPGEHVDKIYNEALGKLSYEGMTGEQLKKATPEQQREDAAKKDNKVGTEVFEDIEASNLSPSEKQEVYQRLAKTGVQRELDKTTNPGTLLRGNSQMTNFMSAYMNKYAKDYMESVSDVALREASKIKLPESVKGKKMTSPFAEVQGVPSEDLAKLHEAYGEVAKKVVEASELNLSKLSPEARAFMKASLEPTQGKDQALNMATASTMLLRGASPMMSTAGNALRQDPSTLDVGNILMGSNVVVQTYANNINIPSDKQLGVDKKQNVEANKLRSQESMAQTSTAYKSIAGGSDTIDQFVKGTKKDLGIEDGDLDVSVDDIDLEEVELTSKVNGLKSTVQRVENDRIEREKADIMKQNLKPFDNRIKELEQRRDQLQNNPTFGDKFKAFFKHGLKGVDGEIEKLNQKIDVTKIAREDVERGVTMATRKEALDRLKQNQASVTRELGEAQGVVIEGRLDKSGLNVGSEVPKEKLDNAIQRGTGLEVAQKELSKAIKTQEKVLSVRDALGPKKDAPNKGVGVKVGGL